MNGAAPGGLQRVPLPERIGACARVGDVTQIQVGDAVSRALQSAAAGRADDAM